MTDNTLVIPALRPVYASLGGLAETMVRVAAGGFLMPHGAQKLFGLFGGGGLEGTAQFFHDKLGFADGYLMALSAGSVEFFGGLMLALGLLTRLSAGAVAVLLAVATTVHVGNGFFWFNGGFEYPVMWTILALSFVVRGGGDYSIDRLIGREL